MVSGAKICWLSSLIEGDGTICILKHHKYKNANIILYDPCIMFANTDYTLVYSAKKNLDKIIHKNLTVYKEAVKKSFKTIYKIKLSSDDAVYVGRKLMPYMIEKKSQMRELINLQNIKKLNNFKKRSPKILIKMENTYQRCKRLKTPSFRNIVPDSRHSVSKFGNQWLAGLIDTEGSIYLFKHHTNMYVSCLVITNTSYRLISEAKYIVESILHKNIDLLITQNSYKRDVYRIRLLGRNAEQICRHTLPYLISKNRQARLICSIQRLKLQQKKRPYPLYVSNKMNDIYINSRNLNLRGLAKPMVNLVGR